GHSLVGQARREGHGGWRVELRRRHREPRLATEQVEEAGADVGDVGRLLAYLFGEGGLEERREVEALPLVDERPGLGLVGGQALDAEREERLGGQETGQVGGERRAA